MHRLIVAAYLSLLSGPVFAQTDLAVLTRGMVEGHILPAYALLSEAASQQQATTQALCQVPSQDGLSDAQAAFEELVISWSAVEFIRFGPARTDNRYERLFFWPDRNGRGLNQVQQALANQDETVTTVESLQGKSVALQGLMALDYVLFGTGSETLAMGDAHRCAYAQSIAGAIARTSTDLYNDWTRDEGYAALMLAPGPSNAVYRTDGEALQELLRAMAEQLQIIHDAKLVRVVGTSPQEARYRRAPFWRSGQSLTSIRANAVAMLHLNMVGGFEERLPEQSQRYAGTLRFELGQVESRLSALIETQHDLETLTTSDETHGRLASVALPLSGAMRVVGEIYPAELGLTMGFNSLDGD